MRVKYDGIWCHIECDEKCTLEEFCEMWSIPGRRMNLMIQMKKALLDGKHMTLKDSLYQKILSLCLFEEEEIDYVCDDFAAEVVYEDRFVLVVNKPAGIIIHEDDKQKHGTLNNRVAEYYRKTCQKHAIRPVHRLDKETSGCVMYCKSPWIQSYFDAAIEKKEIHRTYLAFVHGMASFDSKTVKLAIGKDRHVNGKMRISKTGKEAVTHMKTVCRIPEKNMSVLKCSLQTGRTHQIRLHTSALHLPIINDDLYGKKEPLVQSMGLCARKLEWKEPFTGKKCEAVAKLPEDLQRLFGK